MKISELVKPVEGVVEILRTSKKIRRVPISQNAIYRGQDMRWSERMEIPEKNTSELIIFHHSDSRIKAFYPKETCFFSEFSLISGIIYQAIIPVGATIQYSATGEEIRVDLSQPNIEIFEVAEVETEPTKMKRSDGFGGFVPVMLKKVKIYK